MAGEHRGQDRWRRDEDRGQDYRGQGRDDYANEGQGERGGYGEQRGGYEGSRYGGGYSRSGGYAYGRDDYGEDDRGRDNYSREPSGPWGQNYDRPHRDYGEQRTGSRGESGGGRHRYQTGRDPRGEHGGPAGGYGGEGWYEGSGYGPEGAQGGGSYGYGRDSFRGGSYRDVGPSNYGNIGLNPAYRRDTYGGQRGSADYGHGEGYRSRFYGDRDRNRDEERGWWDRTKDEVQSWFGDEDAERRRRVDEVRAGQHRGRGPRNYTRSDERIREDVNDRLSDDPMVDASDIDVSVSNGEVTLSGTVQNRWDKRRAEDVAEDVSGVKHVQNNLRVQQQGSGGFGAGGGAQTGGFAGSSSSGGASAGGSTSSGLSGSSSSSPSGESPTYGKVGSTAAGVTSSGTTESATSTNVTTAGAAGTTGRRGRTSS
jgi:osmotically-inducible protein OsmY